MPAAFTRRSSRWALVIGLVGAIWLLATGSVCAMPTYFAWPAKNGLPPSRQQVDPKFVREFGWPGTFRLDGVSPGERASEVRAALGRPETVTFTHACDSWFEHWTYRTAGAPARLTIDIIEGGLVSTVSLEAVGSGSTRVTDRYGIRIGDAANRVLRVRGKAHDHYDYDNGTSYATYFVTKSVDETYFFDKRARVSAIVVDWDALP